ncbi:MAG TPA: polysaccharide lyase [Polyangiaceae bacterium]|nr:polysaccharide lyase [Polyangiaceae bacterium]
MKPIKLVPLVVPAVSCLLGAGNARAAVLWNGDFETGDVSQWDGSTAIKTGDRDNLIFVSDQVANGKKAAKITLRDDIIFEPYNQSRVEVKHVGLHTLDGEDSYFAWSFMVPKDAEIRNNIGYWESTPTSKNTMTFFIEPAQGGGTNLKFGTGDLGQTVRWTVKLELNKWHRIALHNHWSQDPNVGKVDVWYDGTQVVTGASVAKRDVNKLFFQMGLHRSDPSPPVQDIYIDAAMEADSQADILLALPDPLGMGGAGGSGGAAGSGGTGGASSGGSGGGATAGGGAGGSDTGTAAGSGGATAGGSTSAGGSSGSATTAGSSPLVTTPNNADTSDDGSCAFHAASTGPSARPAWLLLGLLAAALRKRRRPAPAPLPASKATKRAAP